MRGRGLGRAKGAAGTAARELPQTAAVMGGVLDALLQRTLSSMAGERVWELVTVSGCFSVVRFFILVAGLVASGFGPFLFYVECCVTSSTRH